MKILFIGPKSPGSTSLHRAEALRRIGCEVDHQSPYEALGSQLTHPVLHKIHFRSGYRFLRRRTFLWVQKIISDFQKYQLVWIEGGEFFDADAIRLIRSRISDCILYNVDDPTGNRDAQHFALTKQAIPHYSLCVTVRKETELEMRDLGCLKTLRVWRSYDEVEHAPFEDQEEIPQKYRSEVTFIGTWMRGEVRDKFMIQLIEAGIQVSIWGSQWQKSMLWNRLKYYWRGSALIGRDYVAAIQGAKICLGLLSQGNRDLHTQRSLEITYAGGLLCAQRTSEHQELYKEGDSAVFWSDPEECIARCRELLKNRNLRERIRLAGMQRVRKIKVGNEDICKQILQFITK